jgi:hypothetical protein
MEGAQNHEQFFLHASKVRVMNYPRQLAKYQKILMRIYSKGVTHECFIGVQFQFRLDS